MTEQMAVEKSLAEQIFDQMFAVIEKRSEFDAQTVERLKAFAAWLAPQSFRVPPPLLHRASMGSGYPLIPFMAMPRMKYWDAKPYTIITGTTVSIDPAAHRS